MCYGTLKMLRLLTIYNDLCTTITLVHFLQIEGWKINGIGSRTYPSVTFSIAFLSVFLYFESACYSQLTMEVMISASSVSDNINPSVLPFVM